ncbi:MAG: response regulator [Rhodospirillales bacterium]|nr:response regulator [Rhodospirillales bacterium]
MISYDFSNLKVLIVEKQEPMRSLLRRVLDEFGVGEVIDASSPEEGFNKFTKTRPDLVLIDWAPDFNGLDLVRKIRNDKTSIFPLVPIVMVTAYEETSHIHEALDSGMTEYLSKPLSANLLYQRISTVIENKHPFIRSKKFTGPDRRRKKENFNGQNRRITTEPTEMGYPA